MQADRLIHKCAEADAEQHEQAEKHLIRMAAWAYWSFLKIAWTKLASAG